MVSAVKKTPRTERKYDVLSKLQSLGKSELQHLYPGIFNSAVGAPRTGWKEPRDGEEQASRRGQPLSHGFRDDPKFCECHVVNPSLPTIKLELTYL
jgi:hypothetical protein